MRMRFIHFLPCVALCLASCYSLDCPIENIVACNYGFYGLEEGQPTSISLNLSLTVTAAGTDSVLINQDYGQSSISLPMSYYASVDTLVFTYSSDLGTEQDTVWITKTNYEHYENPNCPTAMFHVIESVRSTNRLIELITIVNPNVNYESSENIHILFYTE